MRDFEVERVICVMRAFSAFDNGYQGQIRGVMAGTTVRWRCAAISKLVIVNIG